MGRVRSIQHTGEAILLRTWPFHEADLLVSLLTREQGVMKGVARHAMRSRRRFGGALEPGTQVVAHYAERPREDLVRLDSFEIVWSPLRVPMDWLRMAGTQLVLEVVEQTLPEQAPEDNVYRLALTVLQAMEERPIWLPVTYFSVWMCRLMGWWPDLSVCAACGADLRGERVWWSPTADGVTCQEDCRAGSRGLSADAAGESARMARRSLPDLLTQESWPEARSMSLFQELGNFALAMLERHLQRRIQSASAMRLMR